jgi:DNA polymerase-1
MLEKLLTQESPDALYVMFDTPKPTFRHEQYTEYKAHRTGMPDELAVQMPILKEILDAMNIARYELPGWEADDLLGTLSKKCEETNHECIIVTGDKDSLQLVSDHTVVKIIKTSKGKQETTDYTPAKFIEEYGFPPEGIIDMKALMGDSSDNIPGVAGVGEKTALDLVARFGSINNLYSGLENAEIRDTLRKKLEAGRENAELSYELATINCAAPFEPDFSAASLSPPDNDKLFELFKRLGFVSLIGKFKLNVPKKASAAERTAVAAPDVIEVKSAADCQALITAAKNADCAALWVDLEYFDCVSVSIINDGGQGGMQNDEQKVYILRQDNTEGFDAALTELLSGEVKKAGHCVKDIMRGLLSRGIEPDGWVFDSAIAAYLISPTDSDYAISEICEKYCGFSPDADSEGDGQMSMLSDTNKVAGASAQAIALLKRALGEKLKELELEKLFYEIEMPLCRVLAEMEHVGFKVEKNAIIEYGEKLGEDISETERKIYELAGEEFNINSPKQLGVILFERLMLPAPKKTKTGYSTDVEVLHKLSAKHPIIEHIKHFREISKLKSTYTDGLLKVIAPDGRIHTRFQMTVTSTGRLSSTEPNLQNIPVRKQAGEELRKMFVAEGDNVLVDADYSQIELRLLAHIAGDEVMQRAFESNEDIHTVTASQVFDTPLDEVTSVERSRAKAVNFGIVYGISAFSLAQDIGVSPVEAKRYIENYLNKYAGVRAYMTSVVKNAKASGYVSTIFGRRRELPELKSSNHNTRSFGERVALNMPIQGTAADIMKIAMINVSNRLKTENLAARLILQVHDELIVECPPFETEQVSRILQEEMENAAQLSVPLVAETRSGKSWHDAK